MYKKTREEARRCGETTNWRENVKQNKECANGIKTFISHYFDGMYLEDGCVHDVINAYGYDRTMWVLAATVKYRDYDGRFSRDNRKWADSIIPSYFAREEFQRYVCEAHPAILDGFIGMVRRAYQELHLLDRSHCIADSNKLDYEKKLLILSPEWLNTAHKKPELQYVYATNGFGCDPKACGTKVYGTFLADGEHTEFRRSDFLGIADETQLPDWVREKLTELQHLQEEENTEQEGLNQC